VSESAGSDDPAEVATLLRMLRRTAAEVECVVQGVSMGSAIPDGASVRIRLDGGASAPPQAAVALLLGGDTFSVHRLIRRGRSRKARGFVITHGDGNLFCDAPHSEAELLGTVVAFRTPGQTEWAAVPPSARQGMLRHTVTPAFERLMGAALELSPGLATAVKNALVLAMTPLFWLRPYQSGRGRSTSRLIGSHAVQPR
jgi:hypothetical protein